MKLEIKIKRLTDKGFVVEIDNDSKLESYFAEDIRKLKGLINGILERIIKE